MTMRAMRTAWWGGLLCLCLRAELLPVRSYSTADGLAGNRVDHIVIDARGFVWLCTPEGLSRFDGYRLTSYGPAQGLAGRAALSFLETRSGTAMVGTESGLSVFQSGGSHALQTYRLGETRRENEVTALFQSSDGRIWAGTWAALFEVLPGPKFRRQALPPPPPDVTGIDINAIAEDGCGKLWLATVSGAYSIARDGTVLRLGTGDGLPGEYVNALFLDREGRLWAGLRGGLAWMRDGCSGGRPGVQQVYTVSRNVFSVAEGEDGALWVGTVTGLYRKLAGGDSFRRFTRANGITDRTILSLASDKAGNLWAGAEGAGAMMIERGGFTTFHDPEGLASDRVNSVTGDRAGHVVAVVGTDDQNAYSLSVFDGVQFRSIEAPRIFATYGGHRAWGPDRILIESRTGEWWGATAGGLCRYAAVDADRLAGRMPETCYVTDLRPFQLFEDSKGVIWASAQAPGVDGDRLMRWDPATRTLRLLSNWPAQEGLVKSFAEDRRGNLWLGLWGSVRTDDATLSRLCRYDGRQLTCLRLQDGVGTGTVFALLTDAAGRLWVGSESGLYVLENPGEEPPRIRSYNPKNGLASATVSALVDDAAGFIYAATGAGIDRVDPATGRIKHFTAADGLARGVVNSAWRDGRGGLWFATTQGISRLTPAPPRSQEAPVVLITGLGAGGAPMAVSQLGETAIGGIRLASARNQLQVSFVAFGDEPEAHLRYSYKLEGSGANWSAPGIEHAVNFAALTSGTYRFLVKAIDSDGLESAHPAEVDFEVLPPLWRRWWFEALAAAALAGVVWFLHSYRVAQMVDLERMRTAIATDLHDDIGSSLSQIAVLSEVARAGMNGKNPRAQESLTRVAALARELVDSLSEIVWSIRATPDGLDSLAAHMREFALDILTGQGIRFELESPRGAEARLSLEARRHLFLMFKECVHNAARHSNCTTVTAELKIADREVAMTVRDDGRGCARGTQRPGTNGGNGIPGMRRRAEGLGGGVELTTAPGEGFRVEIRLPLRGGPFARRRG